MEGYKELLIKGKDNGIRFICKKHYYMSMVLPCRKCVEELNLEMPDPLPRKDSKEEQKGILKLFNGSL